MDEKSDITTKNEKANDTDEQLLRELENPQKIKKIVREGILLAGGGAAILLQVAMPGVGKGVDEHSNFSYRPLDRLRTTMTYVYCMAFGTPEEKKIIIEMVHKAHSVVKGPDYSADDPHLQVWVAATLYAVGIDLYEQVFGRMDEATAEATYREYAVLAVSLRVKPEMWPPTREAFWVYWNEQINKIQHRITPQAKNVAKDLLFNKQVPFIIRVSMPLVRLMTADLLPEGIREGYGLKTSRTRRGMQKVVRGMTKVVYPATPSFIRTYPMRYYLKDMRKRMKKAQHRSDATHLSMAVLVRDVARMVDVTAHSGPDLAGNQDAPRRDDAIDGTAKQIIRPEEPIDGLYGGLGNAAGIETSVDLTAPSSVSFFFCPFLTLNGLAVLPQEDVAYLASKGSLSVPDWSTINEFARQYFLNIHPCLPALDEAEFWRISANSPSHTISLFVLQALLFSSCPYVPLQTLQKCGFSDRRKARIIFYDRAKLLFDLQAEDDAFAKAQGSALLAHHTSAQDPQASNIWLMRAIQNAMIVGCGPGPGDSQINLSMMKRLWWSMVLRDRVLSIGLRRRPQITSVEFNMGANWLTEEDFADEIVNSRVYDPELKIQLFQVLQEQCKLAVLLTDMVALVFSSQGVSSPSLSLTEFQAVLAAIRRIKRYLTKWEAVSIVPPSTSHETVTFFTHLTWMYYYAARVDLAQYEALIIEKHLSFTGTNYRGQLLETGADLRKAMTGLTSAIEFFCGQGRAERMPLSVLAYTAVPLVLAAIDVKLSPSQAEMTIRKRRLDRLGEIVRHSRMLYDVADYVAAGTNHILQLAYITTQEAFLRCGTNAIGSSQMVIEPPSVGMSLGTTAKRVTNCASDALGQEATKAAVDHWLETYDTSQCPEIAPNGRLTEDVGSISQIDSLPEEQAADSPEDDSSESRHDDVFKFITAIGESIRETAYEVEASCSPEETNVGEAAINLNFFEFGSPQSDDITEMHALSGDSSRHLGTGASLSGKDRSDDGGFGPTGFQSIYTSLLRDSVV
ncbi:hypothetical protein ANOM_005442 [Aspergillus nomiae NRRL 13137]|uniref:ER-bound oxygenase mpaB/mpaB'/Rubber oxygenase catalytic domain-containing protein n=1 Tax=Aspergillus nomiae NRRL (strain ATCC 15546 / NRRL 13137 / CBS 260.88 / M93) TaxID=1509407 RepID=A0A0L1J776_ASPN3|nr:uncharacterized protein ANOM_005442 [Aspergillus nomiae NRRL 13137]KNG87592.1 hypothetical protein ANOM_005442 [Aspergillus nomiae NRRL 13137]